MDTMVQARELSGWLTDLRREIHLRPGLDFDLEETALLVERELDEMGIPFRRHAGTGIAGRIEGNSKGPTVLLRADMDGLPVKELTGRPYSSEIPGVMHACGHDGHTACLLGAAKLLNSAKDSLEGDILLVFQPAEETSGGAKPMIDDGLLDSGKPLAALGLHVNPNLKVGTVGINPGKTMAASDMFDLVIRGEGCHGAEPHRGLDAVAIACQTVTALQQIVSRRTDPVESAVLTVGSIHGGNGRNVVASEVRLEGIIRTVDRDLREKLREETAKMAVEIPKAMGGEAEITFVQGYPPLINDRRVCSTVSLSARSILGDDSVIPMDNPSMGVDDFAYFAELCPSCYFMLGVGNGGKGISAPLHSPYFDLDESALPIGAAILAKSAATLLKEGLTDRKP
ncbi:MULTISPECIES: M20 metallopeptidase family protein [Dethiosulfovibrio]|uniref:M20 family metallopeptidase n=3 Tax=Dethiosulfovibrio TaxID=47054 RepID=A0ABS9EN77_9BACT|nr:MULTISPECIES: M20 family metallopeptidase [Dethiosulfovibrio]MCF4114167.1 M20 family metallopeptidase [Dethiosulfovibrio russensis]MCF4142643.1 M20 family metallopeptidase [Dethiosulfovibrio marinus]MCF4145162.1 M20 family metallopeptidase [Dethiosulfovibrio acidaminovorans]